MCPEPTLAESIRAFIMTTSSWCWAYAHRAAEVPQQLVEVPDPGDCRGRTRQAHPDSRRVDRRQREGRAVADRVPRQRAAVRRRGHPPSGVRYEWTLGGKSWDHSPSTLPVLSVEEFDGLWQALVDEFGTDEEARKAAQKASCCPSGGGTGGAGPGRAADRGRLRRVAARPGPRARVPCEGTLRGVPQRSEPPPATPVSARRRTCLRGVGGLGAFRCLHAGCAG